MQCGKANSLWVFLIKGMFLLNSFPSKVYASCLDLVDWIFICVASSVALFLL